MSSPSLELPVIAARPASPPSVLEPVERDRLIARAKALSWLSLAYMTAEGAIAIAAAILAGSVALLGFGLDSAIEALASIIVIWRFTGTRRLSEHAEQRAQRLVAITFFLLAPYIAQDAIRTLASAQHPATSWIGIALCTSSMLIMPALGRAKQRIGSGATAGEGTQNMLCAYLAAGVLAGLALNAALGLWWADPAVAFAIAGLALNAALGLWWADPAVAFAIAGLALNEGRQTWRGDGCCATAPLAAGTDGPCQDDCCA